MGSVVSHLLLTTEKQAVSAWDKHLWSGMPVRRVERGEL